MSLNKDEVVKRLKDNNKDNRYIINYDFEWLGTRRTYIEFECTKCGYKSKMVYRHCIDRLKNNTECFRCSRRHGGIATAIKTKQSKETLTNRLIEKSNKYNYEFDRDFDLIDVRNTKIKCKCNICNTEWVSSADYLLNGKETSCPKCHLVEEKEIIEYLTKRGIKCIQSFRCLKSPSTGKRTMEIDIYLPQLNIGIEYNDKSAHSYSAIKKRCNGYFKSSEEYHEYKTNQCELLGIELIHIFEEDYYEDKDKVLSDIFNRCLNKYTL